MGSAACVVRQIEPKGNHRPLHSMEGKSNAAGIRWHADTATVTWGKGFVLPVKMPSKTQDPYSRLREIVDGNRSVSADTALRLERYFGSEAQGWLHLQAAMTCGSQRN